MDETNRLENGLKSACTGIGAGLIAEALPSNIPESAVCFELGGPNGGNGKKPEPNGGKGPAEPSLCGPNGGNGKIPGPNGGNGKKLSVLSLIDYSDLDARKRLAFRINAYNYKMGIRGAMPEDLMNFVIRKKEEHYIDKFKNQNALMKKFGEDGIKVYVVLDENKTVGQMLHESGVGEDKFIEIIDFMDREGMIKLEHSMPETPLLRPQVQGKKEEPQPAQAQAYVPPARKPPVSPISSKLQITQQAEPDEFAQQGAEPEPKEEPRAQRPHVPGILRDEHTSTPLPPEQERGKLLQPKEEQFVRPRSQIEIRQAGQETERQVEPEGPRPEDLLSPLEKIIFDKFGREGVEVYNLIDGEKTAEQILQETKISESKLVEILEFMDDEGIIKLEKPGKKPPEPPPAVKEAQFEPILDDRGQLGAEPVPLEERTLNVPVSRPVPQKAGVFTRMETNLKLTLKYRGKGQRLLSAMDGKKDTVELSKELGLSFEDIDRILNTLSKRKVVSVGPLLDSDLKDKYGSDGLKIFKRYGRDGVLVYELIGKEKTIKDVILRSRVEPKRAVDIVMFIHKVLGLGVSLDRRILYRQLGIKETPT